MKQIQYILFLIIALAIVSCTDEGSAFKSSRFVSLSVNMPDGEPTTRVGVSLVEGSKNLSVSFSADDKFSIYVRQGDVIQEIENVTFTVNGENGKQGTLAFEMPASVDVNKTYTLYGVCGASSKIKNGRLVVDDNSKIEPSFEFKAPVWFEFTGQGTPSTIQCQYIGTFIVIHVDNQADTDNLFKIEGVISDALYDDLYWDENTNQFSEDFGVSPTSKALSVAAGKKAAFIYNGIPNGKTMETLNVSMYIGKEITWGMGVEKPETPKTVGRTLQQGRAYHVYLTWDGKKLKFSDGEEDVPVADVETFTVNGVSFDMMKVEGGTFEMGGSLYSYESDRQYHQVTLSPYMISKHEVTAELFNAVMGANYITVGKKVPAIVSWTEALAFIIRLNILTGLNFSFPTEAEWEYAARGGKYSKGYKFSGSNVLEEVAVTRTDYVKEVGTLKPNELGIYDMTGNAEEWCYDHPAPYASAPQNNPIGPEEGDSRILRGGYYGAYRFYEGDESYNLSYRRAANQDSPEYSGVTVVHMGCVRLCMSPTSKPDMNVMEKLIDDMVFVEGGTFTMGATEEQLAEAKDDEKPAHKVTVSSFYMCKYEMTEFLQFLATGMTNKERLLPSAQIRYNWSEEEYIKIVEKLNKLTGYSFRLPTEAEWEYAAKGGKYSKGHKYSGSNVLDEVAWTPENRDGWFPMVGGLKKPNELGLYDMSGNVSELCLDFYSPTYYVSSPSVNPLSSKEEAPKIDGYFKYMVIRGGSSASEEYYSHDYRVSARSYGYYWDGGVRLVLDRLDKK